MFKDRFHGANYRRESRIQAKSTRNYPQLWRSEVREVVTVRGNFPKFGGKLAVARVLPGIQF